MCLDIFSHHVGLQLDVAVSWIVFLVIFPDCGACFASLFGGFLLFGQIGHYGRMPHPSCVFHINWNEMGCFLSKNKWVHFWIHFLFFAFKNRNSYMKCRNSCTKSRYPLCTWKQFLKFLQFTILNFKKKSNSFFKYTMYLLIFCIKVPIFYIELSIFRRKKQKQCIQMPPK